MLSRQTIRRHADLVDRMAEAQGIDLQEAMMRGQLSIPDLDDAVLRCTGCEKPCTCAVWLDTQEELAEAAPGYCRNADLFAALKQG